MTGMDPIRWDALLAHVNVARGRLAEVAPRVYPHTLPHVAAAPEQLGAAEARLGHPLDPLHRELLSYGNGWPHLVFAGDMLGTDDLGQGPRWRRAQELLDLYFDVCDTSELPARTELYPLFVSQHETDVMVVRRDGPLTAGGHEVMWLSSEVDGRWPNTLEWLLAVIELINTSADYMRRNPLPPPQ